MQRFGGDDTKKKLSLRTRKKISTRGQDKGTYPKGEKELLEHLEVVCFTYVTLVCLMHNFMEATKWWVRKTSDVIYLGSQRAFDDRIQETIKETCQPLGKR